MCGRLSGINRMEAMPSMMLGTGKVPVNLQKFVVNLQKLVLARA